VTIPLRAGFEDERFAAHQLAHPLDQLGHLESVAGPPDDADRPALDRAEGTGVGIEPEAVAEQCVVADLGVGVERQVVGGNRELGSQRHPQTASHQLR